jgi:hypothetical protein
MSYFDISESDIKELDGQVAIITGTLDTFPFNKANNDFRQEHHPA